MRNKSTIPVHPLVARRTVGQSRRLDLGDKPHASPRMESLEYYALVTVYTSLIIGQANELSSKQVDQLLETRAKPGITTGGRGQRDRVIPVDCCMLLFYRSKQFNKQKARGREGISPALLAARFLTFRR